MVSSETAAEIRSYLFFDDFFFGTLPPALRASDNPIAIACFLLVTFLPDPLLSVPFLRSCIAFFTFFCAVFPYLTMRHSSVSELWFQLNGVGVGLTGSGSGTGVGVVVGEGAGDGVGVPVGFGVGSCNA
jgi:hypothetical protein